MEVKFTPMYHLFICKTGSRTLYIRAQNILAYQYMRDTNTTHVWVKGVDDPFRMDGDHREALAEAILHDNARKYA